MSMLAEVSGVVLRYVAREVEGKIKTTKTKFNAKVGENEHKEVNVTNPVIVFFPNKTVQVMALSDAEQKGFLEQPEVLNLSQVTDQKTPAGRFKNAMRERDRDRAWLDLEDAIINMCVSSSGHPLPIDCNYSNQSIYLDAPIEEGVAA